MDLRYGIRMQLGVIGLGTMGANLARNAASRGATVAVYNRTTSRTDEFMKAHGSEAKFIACHTLHELKAALRPPRPILLMVKAGRPVEDVIAELLPVMDKGDIFIDAGNSLYSDTERREQELKQKGFHFFGMGVSGGEEGALRGPSMMPGGDLDAYKTMEGLLKQMSADDGAGGKCVAHIGPGGAGHFVKMVHNGIEYGFMQLIAEVYDVLRRTGRLTNEELAALFGEWSKGADIGSFLLEITAAIFRKKDDKTGGDLIDSIADAAGQKGTGKWTTEAAMTLGVAIPTINAAVDARILSGDKQMRQRGKRHVLEALPLHADPREVAILCRSALELSVLCSYIQGFSLIHAASGEYGWELDLSEIARIWRGGCIIRSVMLPTFQRLFSKDSSSGEKELGRRFAGKRQQHWRQFLCVASSAGVPVAAHAASLSYFDAQRSDRLPTNLIQAQRDFFGAHTYQRIDTEGTFHTEWRIENGE